MTKSPFNFGKIVSSPTMAAWSQVYNAGNLAAVATLLYQQGEKELKEIPPLSGIGKDLFNNLEAEYFTLETKNLATIKQAILTTCEKVAPEIIPSLAVTVIIENVLYVFLYGPGKILMKRSGKLGVLLEQDEERHITSGSGIIENGDIVILETKAFSEIVDTSKLLPTLEHDKLSEMTEELSPIIHEASNGSVAALAFSYHDETIPSSEEVVEESEDNKEKENEEPARNASQSDADGEELDNGEEPFAEDLGEETEEKPQKVIKIGTNGEDSQDEEEVETPPSPSPYVTRRRLPHRKRLFLTIIIFILIVLGVSVFFFVKKQQDAKTAQIFTTLVTPAQRKYDEAQSLMDLNKNAARDDLNQAQQMLKDASSKFDPKSKEGTQISDLMTKVNDALTTASQITSSNAKQVDNNTSPILQIASKHTDAGGFAQDDKNVYFVDSTGVSSVLLSDTTKEKSVIKNGSDWKSPGGLGTYLGNFYVLDKQDGILKYVSSSSSYSKSTYFADGVKPDLSKAVGIAIDGSIWILTNDGTITKYTKGKQDDLNIQGLDKQLKNPTYIVTTVDMDNIYVLDSGNSRVVVFDKKGNYVAQYQSGIIGAAKAMDVSEKNKKVYVLSGSVTYEIDLK